MMAVARPCVLPPKYPTTRVTVSSSMWAATSTVINAADGLDITQEIVDGLNAEYIRNRNR